MKRRNVIENISVVSMGSYIPQNDISILILHE